MGTNYRRQPFATGLFRLARRRRLLRFPLRVSLVPRLDPVEEQLPSLGNRDHNLRRLVHILIGVPRLHLFHHHYRSSYIDSAFDGSDRAFLPRGPFCILRTKSP